MLSQSAAIYVIQKKTHHVLEVCPDFVLALRDLMEDMLRRLTLKMIVDQCKVRLEITIYMMILEYI